MNEKSCQSDFTLQIQKRVKMKKFKFTLNLFAFSSGAGGIRTLVQTSSKSAFFMLSPWLIVGIRPVSGQPT